MRFKLGKKPARPESVQLKFGSYFKAPELPAVPAVFGRPWLIQNWMMLGNDKVGDCVWASADHETMLFNADASNVIPNFSTFTAISDYSACTGFDPDKPETDNGTDMQEAAAYRQKTGIMDAKGHRHKIDIYAALRPGDLDELALAVFLLGAVPIGINLPSDAESQYDNAEPWDVTPGGNTEGGHCVPVVGRNSRGNFLCVTWGRLQAITPNFLRTYMDEGIAAISMERLNSKGLSPQGFNQAQLMVDFQAVTA